MQFLQVAESSQITSLAQQVCAFGGSECRGEVLRCDRGGVVVAAAAAVGAARFIDDQCVACCSALADAAAQAGGSRQGAGAKFNQIVLALVLNGCAESRGVQGIASGIERLALQRPSAPVDVAIAVVFCPRPGFDQVGVVEQSAADLQ